MQATPSFPVFGSYPEVIGHELVRLRKSRFFAAGQLDPHAEGLARIFAALSWDASSLVSCHNDPNPRNILFDGERVWLVDWELAFCNDPLVDLAILTTELLQAPELEDVVLEAAFGKIPNGRLRARLGVIRLLTRLYYGCIVLDSLAEALPIPPDIGLAASSPAAFRAAVAEGRLASGTPETAQPNLRDGRGLGDVDIGPNGKDNAGQTGGRHGVETHFDRHALAKLPEIQKYAL